MSNINNTIDTILKLLDEQKELLAPSQCEIINAATHYAFESDDSVTLKGPKGSLWVFKDGAVSSISNEAGTAGWPCYDDAVNLEIAKADALAYLKK